MAVITNAVTIITNHHEREVIGGHELTANERAEFDYIDWGAVERGEDAAEFVRYKGQLYDLNDTTPSPLSGWDIIVNDSYFSGVLFRFVRENYDGQETLNPDYVICGRYYT